MRTRTGIFALLLSFAGCDQDPPDGVAVWADGARVDADDPEAAARDLADGDELKSSSVCQSIVNINGDKEKEKCTITGSTADCKCRLDGVLVDTCSGPAADACSIPGGCCGF